MKLKNILFAVAAITFAACSSENEEAPASGRVALTVNARIEGTQTRVDSGGFESTDAIGVFSSDDACQNVKYVPNGDVLKPAVDADAYFFDQADEEVTFTAYYPYTDGASKSISVAVADQTDWLVASGKASMVFPTLDLTFRHALSRLTFTLVDGGGFSTGFSDATVALEGLYASGTLSLEDGSVTDPATGDISLTLSEDATTASSIVIPQTDASFTFKLTLNDNDYTKNLSLSELKAGYSYEYTVTVSKKGLSVADVSVKDWTENEQSDVVGMEYLPPSNQIN